jgi:hypothetical protein
MTFKYKKLILPIIILCVRILLFSNSTRIIIIKYKEIKNKNIKTKSETMQIIGLCLKGLGLIFGVLRLNKTIEINI